MYPRTIEVTQKAYQVSKDQQKKTKYISLKNWNYQKSHSRQSIQNNWQKPTDSQDYQEKGKKEKLDKKEKKKK